eukprot:4874736-Ditylum_brightwellii.AAC.1
MLCILQQQMPQKEEDKATGKEQLLMACMECELSEQPCEGQEERRDCCHQDFMMMMMMMMMVTGSKPASASPCSFSSGFVTPTKSSDASPDGSIGTIVSAT